MSQQPCQSRIPPIVVDYFLPGSDAEQQQSEQLHQSHTAAPRVIDGSINNSISDQTTQMREMLVYYRCEEALDNHR